MASEQDLTSDSLDSSVVPVPKELLGYVKTSLVDHINKSTPEEFSANIHYTEGQLPKLEVLFGGKLLLIYASISMAHPLSLKYVHCS